MIVRASDLCLWQGELVPLFNVLLHQDITYNITFSQVKLYWPRLNQSSRITNSVDVWFVPVGVWILDLPITKQAFYLLIYGAGKSICIIDIYTNKALFHVFRENLVWPTLTHYWSAIPGPSDYILWRWGLPYNRIYR